MLVYAFHIFRSTAFSKNKRYRLFTIQLGQSLEYLLSLAIEHSCPETVAIILDCHEKNRAKGKGKDGERERDGNKTETIVDKTISVSTNSCRIMINDAVRVRVRVIAEYSIFFIFASYYLSS